MATKSQVPVAMSSTALRCTSMFRPPSNQVTSTPNHFPHCSAVSLPEAHQVEPRPQLENAALNFRPKGNWPLPPAPEPEDERQPASKPNPRAATPPSKPRRVQSSVQRVNVVSSRAGTDSGVLSAAMIGGSRHSVRAQESLYQTSRKKNIDFAHVLAVLKPTRW